jgi:hypothetical protein
MKHLRNLFGAAMLLVTALTLTGCGLSDNALEEIINGGSSSETTPPTPTYNAKATPLSLEAIADGTITFKNGATNPVTYKINNGAAQTVTDDPISISAGDIISFWGDNTTYKLPGEENPYSKITCTAECYLFGNIMSLISSTDFENATELTGNNALCRLFKGNTNIKFDASREFVLPALTLSNNCYESLFYGCTGITQAPELPATSLATGCYSFMFSGCSNLGSAPILSATKMYGDCYRGMFQECTSLTTAPELPARGTTDEELAYMCYAAMFDGCTALTTAPALPATVLADWCYIMMFKGCSNLTTAPDLPAEVLLTNCYYQMFYNCVKLNHVKCLATSTSGTGGTDNWLGGDAGKEAGSAATGTKTFIKSSAATFWTTNSVSGIPTGWTVSTE